MSRVLALAAVLLIAPLAHADGDLPQQPDADRYSTEALADFDAATLRIIAYRIAKQYAEAYETFSAAVEERDTLRAEVVELKKEVAVLRALISESQPSADTDTEADTEAEAEGRAKAEAKTDKPKYRFRSLRAVWDTVPRDKLPRNTDTFDGLATVILDEWIQENLIGSELRTYVRFRAASLQEDKRSGHKSILAGFRANDYEKDPNDQPEYGLETVKGVEFFTYEIYAKFSMD